ncbi:MAG: ubiquinol-cytochrome c reductase iron-sulfur subunit [Pseudomonadales bacterium]|uniref:ubiquinol-cytochrome c reductase iron-sulfur subunit n=1 Tax=unclassified Ketobacter TaxID=2639109 RepID=UPI000C43D5FE|nr:MULTISPECIES: ubiquinol-cytochrome c reductase iron-sulfur subunit [unclassified Ketobacter]MAA59765.1 ubiquinol-cytochrome c reductase iron-sulfur subunit [Pseudomonadales bacterium]MEC8811087.1 ubiquinol-cytochrome c reductase iron-sulfur subunit [Pseudomonadota bacterium]HAG95735.1 ubiquinol-cytochrome c reductase iron-sulfur subunit [Gammaproteobacteria bacterium]MAQ25373.1 ubiquinol-cytochrome c reductase iron-sulfur subunit [Pseudomonadales bacterium]MBI25909.1 ubiquinol-cytochrome c |tara:strand:+ start:27334 stop:27933 length:600 start_codon:yes stop_codon:yes gene_type:complete
MSTEGVNEGRRRFLIGATSAVGAVGVVGAAVPFVKSWNPSAKAKTAGAPVVADISKLEVGQRMTVEWRGKPVWILRRSNEAMASLDAVEDNLRDPDSSEAKQPDYVAGDARARDGHEEIVVLIGLCTHLGCSPLYRPEVAPADLGADWMGGFFCPCHGSKFDFSGRVFKSVPAPLNLEVPPYYYMSDTLIKIGEDGEAA